MYIRIKKIRNNDYAYLVKGTWSKRKRTSKQKVVKYLGRVEIPDEVKTTAFLEFHGINDLEEYFVKNAYRSIIDDLVAYEMKMFDIEEIETKVYRINEGYLCGHNVNRLKAFRADKYKNPALEYAKLFLSAGLRKEEDIFIMLFHKNTIGEDDAMNFNDFADKVGY